MFLKRVKVDDFRVLKNVDLTFEPDFVPSTFPLGSLNGGGKSTLLQLIFTLLHCSFDKKKRKYLVNLLSENVKNKPDNFVLSQFELVHEDKELALEFIIVNNSIDYDILAYDTSFPDDFPEYNDVVNCVESLLGEREFKPQSELTGKINNRQKTELFHKLDKLIKIMQPRDEMDEVVEPILKIIRAFRSHFNENKNDSTSLHRRHQFISSCLDDFLGRLKVHLDAKIDRLYDEQNRIYITHLDSEKVLLCQTIEPVEFVRNISHKVFLAAPSTQVFLFLSAEEKKTLFSTENNYGSYILKAKQNLQGLFAYDFASMSDIIDAFKKARDEDFSIALESGHYHGDSLKKLRADLSSFLFGKSVVVDRKLSRVIFKLTETDEELSPEDLSHGELKKLGIYVWLKYQGIENALVLMDEIEIGLHPDWQYEIANELQEWSRGNQFILATHSYELCRALTPLHVKELLPKLIKK